MNGKSILFLSIMMLMFHGTLTAADKTDQPVIQFVITAEKEAEADVILFNIRIEKKSGSFAQASSDCNILVNKFSEALKKAGIADRDITVRNYQNNPSEWLFGKDYTVTSRLEIKIRDKDLLPKILKEVNGFQGQISVENVSFDYEKKDSIRQELVRIGAEKTKARKAVYEEAFGIKLKLLSIIETEAQYYPGYQFGLMRGETKDFSDISSAIEKFPVRTFNINMIVQYSIAR